MSRFFIFYNIIWFFIFFGFFIFHVIYAHYALIALKSNNLDDTRKYLQKIAYSWITLIFITIGGLLFNIFFS